MALWNGRACVASCYWLLVVLILSHLYFDLPVLFEIIKVGGSQHAEYKSFQASLSELSKRFGVVNISIRTK